MKYPEMSSISQMWPGPQILLGRRIHWEEKRDGSNLRVSWDKETQKIVLHTRHMEASEQFQKYFYATPHVSGIEGFLRDFHGQGTNLSDDFSFDPIIFGELLCKGKSPARFEVHEDYQFIVFDIYDPNEGRFLPYTVVYQHCYHYGIPIVDCYGVSRHTTLDSLFQFRDEMLLVAEESGREGVVLKAFAGKDHIYAKEKLDTPKFARVEINEGGVFLPYLPESEVFGAINKSHADLGEDIKDKTKAMPMIAAYIKEECRKHMCSAPDKKLYTYYLEYLEGLSVS